MIDKPNPIEIFYCYSHRDENLRDELEKHLNILRRQGVIASWHDRRIGPGKEWEGQIDEHLNKAHVVLLLVSSDFLASDYCYDVEMRRGLERHEAGEARVIPVIVRACLWDGAPFSKLQALPKDAQPITSWTNIDEAFFDIAKGVRTAIQELVSPNTSLTKDRGQGAPHVFLGTATVNGLLAPPGTPVIAMIGGKQRGSTTVRSNGQYGPLLVFQGNGAKVLFLIGDAVAQQTATWAQGGADVLNLTIRTQPYMKKYMTRRH